MIDKISLEIERLVAAGHSGVAVVLICVLFVQYIGLPLLLLIVVINTLCGHSGRQDG